jgi:catechol 2,3-dioxygenase-like lactoylglutathione lyase family enzyme
VTGDEAKAHTRIIEAQASRYHEFRPPPDAGRRSHPRGFPVPVEISALHPVLMARDVAASVGFYARLGFELMFLDDPSSPRYAGVRRGPVQLHLQWADPGQWDPRVDRPAYRFLVSDVDALHAEFLAAGGLASGSDGPWAQPSETPWGTREFHLRDPGGNSLQFYRPAG